MADYLEAAGMQTHLDALGFTIAAAVDDHEMTVVAALSGNRNFKGRISPHVKASCLASPATIHPGKY